MCKEERNGERVREGNRERQEKKERVEREVGWRERGRREERYSKGGRGQEIENVENRP